MTNKGKFTFFCDGDFINEEMYDSLTEAKKAALELVAEAQLEGEHTFEFYQCVDESVIEEKISYGWKE